MQEFSITIHSRGSTTVNHLNPFNSLFVIGDSSGVSAVTECTIEVTRGVGFHAQCKSVKLLVDDFSDPYDTGREAVASEPYTIFSQQSHSFTHSGRF